MYTQRQLEQLSFDCNLPSAIFFNQNLDLSCIKLYAVIRNLTRMSGYCYASNEYLAEIMGFQSRHVKTLIKKLRTEGYIEIHTNKEQIHWRRFIYISDKFKIELRRALAGPGGVFCQATPPGSGGPPIKEEKSNIKEKEIDKEKEEGIPVECSAVNPPMKRKAVSSVKKQVAPEVWITEIQENNLIQKMNGNEDKLKRCYEKLSEWKIGKETTGGNDYLSILRWVIQAVEEEANKPKPVNHEQENKETAQRVQQQFPNHRDIEIGYNYIEFKLGPTATQVKFTDYGFSDQVRGCLAKMGLVLKV